ncbi:MAG: hypothetical protein JO236_16370 [Mycobacterium sp.]|uniref:hypothetical protein n=1 Tax=Mycobacterium sp. TaxID=1785 RepID=UPI001ED42AAE|nr:hypothetical protein [Mycobacterium sp.]MBW0019104.1 hypothetical protein [Mycobacterium sp.]
MTMNVGESVKQSLDRWERKDWDGAMLYACNAVDETGRKRYPTHGVGTRFRSVIRDALDIFGVMATPGVDLDKSRFPVAVRSDLPDKRPDIADVVYGIHRRSHDHDDELPAGFELTPYVNGRTVLRIAFDGKVQLTSPAVVGLLAIAVFAPENKGESIPSAYQLTWYQHTFYVASWWGWQDHFREMISIVQSPRISLDFGDAWDTWVPLG